MRHYNKILYVSNGVSNEQNGLKQALSLARNNDAPLKIMVFSPKFPKDLPEYKERFEQSILDKINTAVSEVEKSLLIEAGTLDVSVELATNKTPAVVVIKKVIQNGFDLIIKEAELRDGKGGFKAIDMDLLRKSPVPVWLCRPITESRSEIKVAVAIDPDRKEPAADRLSIRLLQLSDSLAKQCDNKLNIISCWDFELESALRDNVFIKMPADEVDIKIEQAESDHHKALTGLIQNSGINGNHLTHHIRGKASEIIPDFVDKNGIDILVMGSVARTGIAGFIFGNTAENIIQQLSCSLLTLKPHGFVSSVKA